MIPNLSPQAPVLYSQHCMNAVTLRQFLVTKFLPVLSSKIIPDFNNKEFQVLEELEDYGILTLEQLNDIIPQNLRNTIEESKEISGISFVGLLRTIMILHDRDRYFTRAWNRSWWWLTADMTKIFELYNISPDKLPVNCKLLDNRYAILPTIPQ